MRSEGFYVNEKSTDTSWDRISDLPICNTVLLRSPTLHVHYIIRSCIYIAVFMWTPPLVVDCATVRVSIGALPSIQEGVHKVLKNLEAILKF